MRCTSPRTVGFLADGKTITWSQKKYSKEYPTFQLPCGKCISCRLEYARQWAVRCTQEAQMNEKNCFITLTYNEESLKSPKLQYLDFQLFTKRLRHHIHSEFLKTFGKENWKLLTKEERKQHHAKNAISIFCTGEYGDRQKRPHWHACIFNWEPPDRIYSYSNSRGDKSYSSEILTQLWGQGKSEFGAVTFESAGYCARYAAKKLVHGNDDTHDYNPISKKSSKHAIGKKFLEKHWTDVFNLGQIVLPDGQTCSIPRYYEKWLKKNHPIAWADYVTTLKNKQQQEAINKSEKDKQEETATNNNRSGLKGPQISKNETRSRILRQKFDNLQKHLKL